MATHENGQAEGNEGNESEGSALRRQLEAALNENKTLKAEKRERAFKDAGLDPERGIGKAVAKLYEGDVDPESIQDFAKAEFEWEPPSGEEGDGDGSGNGTGNQNPNPSGWTPERQQALNDGESRRAGMANGALPPRDPSTTDRMKQAEAEGDWDTFDRLAAQELTAQQ